MDSSDGTDFAYVGRRTTGTAAGDFLITGPGWHGTVLNGARRILAPNDQVLVIGRVLVGGEADFSTACALSQQIRLTAAAG